MATLQQVLDLLAAADEATDSALPLLSELMGVPNPDADDATDDTTSSDTSSEVKSGLSLGRLALLEDLAAHKA